MTTAPLSFFVCLQVMFMLYMVIAALLLVNMLIAMMGTTYQNIAERRNEWMRQVKIIEILDLEQVCWHRSCKYFWGKNTL
jgi:hypothetical protein